jgi:DNA-binding response OmpR family regulator
MDQQLRVLVAADEPLVRALVALAFEAEGYAVDTAADGQKRWRRPARSPRRRSCSI